ncbi:MAG: response regulator transcription factor [Sporichthyaceae bacterium]|nr:response regulator transcription factor [Sporichthyaceae bacterium]
MSTAAHILVVDDDEPIAASVRRALEYEGYRVSVAHDGRRAVELAGAQRPDLVVLDVMLPGLDGIGVCDRLRARGIGSLILMLTARDTTADRVHGLDHGADDYLVKPFAYEELLARIRALLRRTGPRTDADLLELADLVIDVGAREVHRGGRPISLTALEFDLLRYFAERPRRVCSRAQLLAAVWGIDFDPGSNVVDVYVGYLRAKLEVDGQPRLLHTVRGVGYVLRPPEPGPGDSE